MEKEKEEFLASLRAKERAGRKISGARAGRAIGKSRPVYETFFRREEQLSSA